MDLAAVYSRRIDGQILTLAPSGWTYENTFVLYDKETGSLWYPFEKGLMSIQGKFFKRRLPKIPFEDTIWRDWIKKHPESSILE
ncbi:MAG: DUF3179 domain-containing protein [Deltaproteobacteria bacterium]|nr:DUF3179 domain-containing protein [Deltaproteobacteria bacterium]MBW2143206.1 DUF3179 domain-containing protein [Deltaproteobacteria bacterium]